MSGSGQMNLVAKVFDGRQRKAAIELAKYEQLLETARRQLTELESYRGGYSRRLSGQGQTNARQLGDLGVMISRLDAAIVQQRAQIAVAEQNRDAARERWLVCRQRQHAVAQVCLRQAAAERLKDDRREQNHNDEMAARTRTGPMGRSR